MKIQRVLIVLSLTLCCSAAFGYVGPGTGITLVSSLIGLVMAVVVSLWALLSWPLRQLVKRLRSGDEAATTAETTELGTEAAER